MASPVTPATFQALIISVSGNLCTGFLRLLLQAPVRLYEFINWMLGSDGNVTDAFRAQLWPAGTIILSAAATKPTGNWLECNGSSQVRGDYAALFTAIGETFGSVDGTHFTLPDLRGRAAIGEGQLLANDGTTTGENYSRGNKIGQEEVELVDSEIPPVFPIMKEEDSKLFIKTHGLGGAAIGGPGPWQSMDPDEAFTTKESAELDTAGAAKDPVPADGAGGGHENRTPSLVLKYWIAY